MVEEGLHIQIIIHTKSFELLGQGEVHKDHIMDLNSSGLVSSNWKSICPRIPVVPTGIPPRSSWRWPSNGVEAIGRLESSAVDHEHG